MKTFVLAGGFATRLWPLTERRAKPLLPLAGRPLLSYAIESLPRDMAMTVSTNDVFKNDFEQWKKDEGFEHVEILIEDSGSDDVKLGALGAIAKWVTEDSIDDDVLVIAGDNYCGFPLNKLFDQWTEEHALVAAYDIASLEEAKKFGTVVTEGTKVIAFEEKPAEPKTTLVNTGYSILPKNHLPILVEYAKEHPDNIGGIFEELLRRNEPIDCFTFTEPWFDIGSFGAYLEATAKLVNNKVHTGTGAVLDASHTVGSVVLGENTAAKESELENVVAFENCQIEDCVLRDCIIDNNCTLKGVDLTGKMIREGTVLQRQ